MGFKRLGFIFFEEEEERREEKEEEEEEEKEEEEKKTHTHIIPFMKYHWLVSKSATHSTCR